MTRRLSDVLKGHDNNYAFIRLICAYLVVFQHAIFLASANYDLHDKFSFMHIEFSAVAVQVFFVISGFLVTGSLITRGCLTDFIWSRILRIMPALLVVLTLSIFLVGPLVTTQEVPEYLSSFETYRYLVQNSLLVFGAYYELPGVFESNPYASIVNGSLWTLPHELRLYLMLAFFWLITSLSTVSRLGIRLNHLLITVALVCFVTILDEPMVVSEHSTKAVLILLFVSGGLFRYYASYVPLSGIFALGFILTLVILAITGVSNLFYILYVLAIPYLLLFCAYFPSRFMRWFNKLGDYSYGIYIYSFVIQQSMVFYIVAIDEMTLLVLSTLASFFIAFLSWHLLEQRALKHRKAIVAFSKKMMGLDEN